MATILCIDDNKNILELHKAVLESDGHAVLIAANGASGVALSRRHAIDAIVLDFNMPGMDGARVAEIIAKEQPTVPVVVCSGQADAIPEPLRWFADALVEKADGPHVLLSTVARLVDKKLGPRQIPAHGKPHGVGSFVA